MLISIVLPLSLSFSFSWYMWWNQCWLYFHVELRKEEENPKGVALRYMCTNFFSTVFFSFTLSLFFRRKSHTSLSSNCTTYSSFFLPSSFKIYYKTDIFFWVSLLHMGNSSHYTFRLIIKVYNHSRYHNSPEKIKIKTKKESFAVFFCGFYLSH